MCTLKAQLQQKNDAGKWKHWQKIIWQHPAIAWQHLAKQHYYLTVDMPRKQITC